MEPGLWFVFCQVSLQRAALVLEDMKLQGDMNVQCPARSSLVQNCRQLQSLSEAVVGVLQGARNSLQAVREKAVASSLQQPLLESHPVAGYPASTDDSDHDDGQEQFEHQQRAQTSAAAAAPPVRSTVDLDRVQAAQRYGKVVYVIGRTTVHARAESTWLRKLLLEVVYNLLVNNCRSWGAVQQIPHVRLIQVGMMSEI